MSDDQTSGQPADTASKADDVTTQVVDSTIAAGQVVDQAATTIAATTEIAAAAPEAPRPPRPLDAIHADIAQAKQRHAAAVTELQASGDLLASLTREFRSAVTWFDEECGAVESDVKASAATAESWIKTTLAKLL